ncbi:hypothetical protein AHAS_Ahas05G0127300 [Arachis hypogaea]
MVIIELQLKHEYPSICYNLVVILCNSDLKLLACLTMLANRADEIIVTTMVQRQSGVLHEVLSQSLFHRTMIVVLFFNLHHRVQSRIQPKLSPTMCTVLCELTETMHPIMTIMKKLRYNLELIFFQI